MPGRQLLLLRHAKAVAAERGMADIDRPLSERGEQSARAIGRYMAANGLIPDLVLYSPARRTRQTWEIAARELTTVRARMAEALHDFGDGSALLEVIRSQGRSVKRLMLVTHNPATHAVALALSGHGEKPLRGQMAEKYPTGALAVLSFPGANWSGTAEGSGTLEAFIRPRDLLDG